MLRFFRLNDPYRLLGVLLILIIVSLPLLIQPAQLTLQELKGLLLGEALSSGKSLYIQLIDDAAPLAAWFSKWVFVLFGKSITARHLLALLLIFFQASYFGILLINNKAHNENTYVPSLIFAILTFFSFDLLSLSPELLASTILLFALNNLFKEIEFKVQRDEIILNLGIYLGLASLIIFSYSIFLVGAIAILILFTRITFRKTLLLIFGFILPHAVIFSFYFFWNNQVAFADYFYLANIAGSFSKLISLRAVFILGIVPIIYFFLALFMLNREAHFTKYQSQLLQVMFLWVLVALVQVALSREFTPHSFYPFIPPLAYFISHYLLLIRRKRIAEAMLWVFIVGILSTSWASRKGKIESVDYSSFFPAESEFKSQVANKRLLVLGDDLGIFKGNKMAGYFLNWSLSKEIFEHPEYFENIVLIDQSFQNDAPEVIIDKDDLMKPILERIPRLQSLYRREGKFYYKVSN